MAGKALDDDGIDTEADLFQQALDHVLNNYGRASVDGATNDGREGTWVKIKNMLGSAITRLTVRAPGGEEIPEEELVTVLQSQPVGDRTRADLRSFDDEYFEH